jgi:hypothetical protein
VPWESRGAEEEPARNGITDISKLSDLGNDLPKPRVSTHRSQLTTSDYLMLEVALIAACWTRLTRLLLLPAFDSISSLFTG